MYRMVDKEYVRLTPQDKIGLSRVAHEILLSGYDQSRHQCRKMSPVVVLCYISRVTAGDGMKEIIWFLIGVVLLGVVAGLLQPAKKGKSKRKRKRTATSASTKKTTPATRTSNRSSRTCRPDEVILSTPLDGLNGVEFERLLALYFRDQGYKVNEVGVGGNDGGVDLVIVDMSGEKTAVQAKCYADHNLVPVQTVRELVAYLGWMESSEEK